MTKTIHAKHWNPTKNYYYSYCFNLFVHSNPTPVNSGQFCTGDPVQVAECIVPCATVEGTYWSAWSQWSPCSHECTQVRSVVR